MKRLFLFFPLLFIFSVSAEKPTEKLVEKPAEKKLSAGAGAEQQLTKTVQKDSSSPSPQVSKSPAKTPSSKKQQARHPSSAAKNKKKPNTRLMSQIAGIGIQLHQSLESLEKLLDELSGVCRGNHSLAQKTASLQQKLIMIKQKTRQIKEDFVIRDPSIHSYIHTLNFYLNESKEFNYEKNLPTNTEELKEYVSGLSLSFQYMYQMAFNIPENTPLTEFPKGWGRSIGTALHCLENHK